MLTLTSVTTVLLIDQYHGKEAALDNLNAVTHQGWKNTREISTLVKNKYLTDRDTYRTFDDFVPVILDYLKAASLN